MVPPARLIGELPAWGPYIGRASAGRVSAPSLRFRLVLGASAASPTAGASRRVLSASAAG